MNIYSLPLPYVYIVTNKITGEYYIGSRYANVRYSRTPEQDLRIEYFTSGPLKEQLQYSPNDFDHRIIFRSGEQVVYFVETQYVVFWYEQLLIKEHIGDKLCLNSLYFDPDTTTRVFSRAGKPMSWSSLSKLRKTKTGTTFSPEVNAKKGSPGSKNGMFGRSHSVETKKLLSDLKKQIVGPKHFRFGKPGTMTGKTILPVTVNGVTYRSKNAACKALNTNYYQLNKLIK